MVVYWTIYNGDEGATCDNVDLLRALLGQDKGVSGSRARSALLWRSLFFAVAFSHRDLFGKRDTGAGVKILGPSLLYTKVRLHRVRYHVVWWITFMHCMFY